MSTNKPKGFFSRVFGTNDTPETPNEPDVPVNSEDEQSPNEIPEQAAPEDTAPPVSEPSAVTRPNPEPLQEPAPEISSDTETEQPAINAEVDLKTETNAIVDTEMEAEAEAETETQGEEPKSQPQKQGWFARLQSGLSKTSSKISSGITGIFTQAKLNETAIQDLEDILIQSDLGVSTSTKITDRIAASRYDKDLTPDDIRDILSDEISTALTPVAIPLNINKNNKPHVLMMIGVNGAGKTTTIGKLASQFRSQDKKVMLVAGDTFRAAAVDQLGIWAERTGASFMSRDIGADAAGLAFDAIKSARKSNTDIVMIDTAGRLQNKATLMAELEKIIRVIKKIDDTAPHSVILVLDATTGQNALNQVEIFLKQAGVSGIIMTKLDGTARGGILVSIAEKYALPIHAIGVGEQVEDLQAFDPKDFANAIANN